MKQMDCSDILLRLVSQGYFRIRTRSRLRPALFFADDNPFFPVLLHGLLYLPTFRRDTNQDQAKDDTAPAVITFTIYYKTVS
jgi:hypothetical protein